MSVLLMGFYEQQVHELIEGGMPVKRVYLLGAAQPKKPVEGVTFTPFRVLTGIADDDVFAPTLDEAIAAKARETGFRYFRRTHFRLFSRTVSRRESWLDVENHFEAGLQYFWKVLNEDRISTVLFNNVPHIGSTQILYHLCKAMGIRTIVPSTTMFSDYMWIAESIEDLGIRGPETDDHGTLEIKYDLEIPFLFRNLKRVSKTKLVGQIASRILNTSLKYLIAPLTGNWNGARKSYNKLTRIYRVYKVHNLPDHYYSDPVEGEKFIYVPLHLQPEMTTDITGGDLFVDQALAVEQLARHLPDDFSIYIKENPLQTAYMRDASFYKRILSIPSVKLIRSEYSSHALIKNSVGVANICGTAGWECLQARKPTITFGLAWYRDLPGAFEWTADHADVMQRFFAFDYDHDKLVAAVAKKEHLLWPGLVDPILNLDDKEFPHRDRAWKQAVETMLTVYHRH